MSEAQVVPAKPPELNTPVSTLTGVGVVAAMALAAFSYVTTESLPVGLLTLLAADLEVSLSAVGLLVTGYGLTVAVASVPLARLTRRLPRRLLFCCLLGVLAVAALVSAAAGNYWVLLGARVASAASQAVFWAMVAPTVAGLFSPRVRGRVIAATMAGASFASVLGLPIGTWIGHQAGWRAAFVALAGLGVLAMLAVALLLPARASVRGRGTQGATPDRRRYWIVVATTMIAITGVFTAYTYIVPFLTQVSGFAPAAVSSLLLVFGVGGLAGTAAVGPLVDRSPRVAMAAPLALMTVTLTSLYLFGGVPEAAIGLLALFGFCLAGIPTAMQSRILQVAPGSTEVASAVNSAAFNVGIAGGALLGGVLLPHLGARSTPLAAAVFTTAALTVVLSEPLVVSRVKLTRLGSQPCEAVPGAP